MSGTVGKIITCRAAVAWGPKQPLSIETIEVAPPKAHEVRVKIAATGVCHSDANVIEGFDAQVVFPVILGHEAAGVVESVGKGVTNFKEGDHVIPLFVPQCKTFKFCKNPSSNHCGKILQTNRKGVMSDGTSRFTCKGKTVYHFMSTSTFSEYTVLADISLCKVNKDAPLNKICLLGGGISTGYGAALNTAKVTAGSVCAVWGLGAVGMATIMGCHKAGASRIYGIDINPKKFDIARKFGCTDFVNPNDYKGKSLQDALIEMTNGGFDFTFECFGNVNKMRIALESCSRGWGTSVIVGIAPSGQETSTLPFFFISGRTCKGTLYGGWKSVDSIPNLVEKYLQKELMVDEFITHKMGLEQINEAFDLMYEGKSIRSVVEF